MSAWAWIILTGAWLGALAAAVSGVGLLGWAVLGRRRVEGVLSWARTGVPSEDEIEAACWGTDEVHAPRRAHCDCCGYELRGLESGHCPECGWSYRTDETPKRKRLRMAAWGCLLLLAVPVLWKTPDVVRSGPAAAVPSALLAEALPFVPWADSAIHRELVERLRRDSVSTGARQVLAERCADIIVSRRPEPVRLAAATLLNSTGAPGNEAEKLTAALNDPSAAVRRRIVESLCAMAARREREPVSLRAGADPGVVPCLVWTALTDPDVKVRTCAVGGLTGLRKLGPRADVFLVALQDPAPEVRERALYSIHARWMRVLDRSPSPGKAGEIDAIARALHDRHATVREAAAYTLGRFAAVIDRAVLALAPALHDPEPDIRRDTADRLCGLGSRAAPAWAELMVCMNEDDPAMQRAVLDALGAIREHFDAPHAEPGPGRKG